MKRVYEKQRPILPRMNLPPPPPLSPSPPPLLPSPPPPATLPAFSQSAHDGSTAVKTSMPPRRPMPPAPNSAPGPTSYLPYRTDPRLSTGQPTVQRRARRHQRSGRVHMAAIRVPLVMTGTGIPQLAPPRCRGLARRSPPAGHASPPTCRPSPPTCRPSPLTRRPSPPTCRPSPPTCRPSTPTCRPPPPNSRDATNGWCGCRRMSGVPETSRHPYRAACTGGPCAELGGHGSMWP